MKLFQLWQTVNNDYDTYDSAIVAAESEEIAKQMHPSNGKIGELDLASWCAVERVKVEYLGEAKEGTKQGLILASFNAG
jgi:hypothetical protein